MQAPYPQQAPERSGNPAVRYGLIFGGILTAVSVVSALIRWAAGGYDVRADTTTLAGAGVGFSLALACLGFLLLLGLTFVAGMRAAGETGRTGTGALAGLIAALVGAVVGDIIGVIAILTVVAPNAVVPANTHLTQSQYQTTLIVGSIVGVFFGLLLDAGIGAGLGALGGLVGSNNYRKAQPVTMYSGMPPVGYPPYGGAPGYPPPPYPGAPGYPNAPQQPQYPYPPQQPPEQPPYGTPPVGPQ